MSVEEQSNNLRLTKLELKSFRNYSHLLLEDIDQLSLFVGENAVGKTNIIEAIQLVTELKSFRSQHIDEYIRWGDSEASIKALFSNGIRSLEIEMNMSADRRSYSLNNKTKRIQDLKGLVPSVTFSPDNLTIVKGSPIKRRDCLDSLGSQLSKNFYSVRLDYQRLIKQKNQALKDDAPPAFIESINDVLAKVGAQYIIHRQTLIEKISPVLNKHYTDISSSKENLTIQYSLSWDENNSSYVDKEELFSSYRDALTQHLQKEIDAKRSLYGPHADRIDFLINNKNALQFASQGQQRSVVLAYKLAEVDLIQEILHQKPLLLLDDVMSELDAARRAAFMSLIQQGIQTCITTTNLSYFEESTIKQAQVYHLPF